MIEESLQYFGIEADPVQSGRLSFYVRELERWNRRMNLTGLIQAEGIVRDLVSDAFFLHTVIPSEGVVLDLGSGAGILGVPLAVLSPARTVRSIDKSLKKIQFQRHIKRSLDLSNMEVFHGRAENLESVHADVLVAKAFGSVSDVLRLGGLHLIQSASAFLVRGSNETAPREESGFTLSAVHRYQLPKSPKAYQLFIYKKVTQVDVLC
jgi:16S rRNA (guanine527-N7)-methyltransferase